ncbi:MAG: LPXTG cell wall anchor domain-containing protein, partial [Lachnospiraceae bacterium]|nr:LPXTG cell wall anchor domain-containing protein [Lachnospiraceae bacterium]
ILSYFPEDIDASVGGHYVITDKIDKSITAYPDTLRVYVVPSMDTVVEKSYQIQEETHYEKSFDKDTNTLEVRITNEGMEFLGVRAEEYKDQYIKLMFDNHLDNSAVKGVDIYSYASVEYSIPKVQNRAVRLNPSDTGIKYRTLTAEVSENPEVHTGQFPLYKVDANNKTKYLEGAKFGIAESEKDARNGKFVQIKTTDKNGYILFSGLKYGEDGDNAKESSKLHDYWLVEIMAPKGYIKLSEPEKVKFNYIQHKNGENYIGDITVYNEKIKGVSSKNKNIVKTVLDKVKTGDVSSINILVGGLVLSVGVLLLIFRRRVISR